MILTRALTALLAVVALPLSAGCTSLMFATANAPSVFGSFKRTGGVAYGESSRQKLDIYAPAKASNRPVVVFWYGGSWVRGSRSEYRFVGAALAERGYVVVLPDYRLYPDVRFPEFLDDGAQAVAWVQQNAANYGGDPQRVVLMGHSAGAHLAAYLALNDQALAKQGGRPEWIRGLVGLSGPYVLEANSSFLRSIFRAPYTSADWQPVRFVTERAPPALLFHGLADTIVYPSHSTRLRDALLSAGVRADAELYPDRGHAATVAAFTSVAPNRAPVLERTVQFIESVTSQTGQSQQSGGE